MMSVEDRMAISIGIADARRRRAESGQSTTLERQARLFQGIAQNSTDDNEALTWARGAGTLRLIRSQLIQGTISADEAQHWIAAASLTLGRRLDEVHAERANRRTTESRTTGEARWPRRR